MRKINVLALVVCASLVFIGCGSTTLKDGTFKGVVHADEIDSKNTGDSDLTLEVKDGKIVKCIFVTRDGSGKAKDVDYAKEAGEKNYQKAQKSVAAIKEYEKQLVEKQDIKKVEAVSGATINHDIFVKAYKDAVKQMK